MDKSELENALHVPEEFRFPDYREESREDFIKLINEFMREAKRQAWFSDQVQEKRSEWLVLMIQIIAMLISGRISIDGIPVTLYMKEKKDDE